MDSRVIFGNFLKPKLQSYPLGGSHAIQSPRGGARRSYQQWCKGKKNFVHIGVRASIGGGDLRFGLFGLSDFRKLVVLDHRKYGEISRNLHFYYIFKLQFSKKSQTSLRTPQQFKILQKFSKKMPSAIVLAPSPLAV